MNNPLDINLSNLSLDELKTLRKRIASELNYRSHQQLIENKNSIRVGDFITVDNPKTIGKIFRVTSMRRTKASIENVSTSRESYTLPISMMVKTNETHNELVQLGYIKQ